MPGSLPASTASSRAHLPTHESSSGSLPEACCRFLSLSFPERHSFAHTPHAVLPADMLPFSCRTGHRARAPATVSAPEPACPAPREGGEEMLERLFAVPHALVDIAVYHLGSTSAVTYAVEYLSRPLMLRLPPFCLPPLTHKLRVELVIHVVVGGILASQSHMPSRQPGERARQETESTRSSYHHREGFARIFEARFATRAR